MPRKPTLTERAAGLIAPGDPLPFELINPQAVRPILLVCDHASRAIPRRLDHLGLDDKALARHIAWDLGAAALTRRLADRLGAPAVLAGYSRLVIDLNRQPGDPQSIVASSDGVFVPGNAGLSPEDQEARAEAFHWPYHHAVDQAFARLRRAGPEPVLFSVHTFTPTLGGEDRHWDVGILWNRDPRLAVPLIEILRGTPGLRIGDNEPYSGRDIAYTLNLHAGAAGLAHCAVEVRQDHCETPEGIDHYADLLAEALARALTSPNVHRIEIG
ncbi:MAG: N-formylglutamate amidohydrolase [Rhodospirillales bacterium]|nr:N-formylglutamate amidohydrolase [Rhodospirillales bacterium]